MLLFILFALFISIGVTLLLLLSTFGLYNRNLVDFGLDTEISRFFFIPEYLHWDFLFPKLVTGETVILSIIDMEGMANS